MTTVVHATAVARARATFIGLAAGVVLVAGAVPTARAGTIYDQGCMQNVAGFGLNCNSNDVRIAGVAKNPDGSPKLVINDGDGCAYLGDTVNFTATFEVLLGAQARYDIGIYFAEDADLNNDGALTGTCSITTLDQANTPNFINLDAAPDTCGDINAANNPMFPTITLDAVCVDDDNDGFLNLPNCLSWRQPGSNTLCTSGLNAFPGAPSKCKCDAGFNVPIDVPQSSIEVVKTVSPESLNEPGGSVTYTVAVTNNGVDPSNPFTLSSLVDDPFGDLNGQGNCSVPQPISVGGTYTCTFSKSLTGDGGSSHTNVVTASGSDARGNEGSAEDDAVVTFLNVAPVIDVDKSANPTQVAEPGGSVTYTVTVTNNSNAQDPVTITSISDDKFGSLAGDADCQVGTVLQPSGSCNFTFVQPITGNAGYSHTNLVTVNVLDNDDDTATDSDSANVIITNTPGQIRVTKTANPTSLYEPGGSVTFNVLVENLSTVDAVTLQALTDVIEGGAPINLNGKGNCVMPQSLTRLGGSTSTYSCSFTLPLQGNAGETRTDVVRAEGVDDDGDQVFADDDATVTFIDVPPAASVVKKVTQVVATYEIKVTNESGAEELYLTSLLDDKFGELIGDGPCGPAPTLAPKNKTGDTFTCTFQETVTESPHENTVTVTASDDEGGDIDPAPTDDATVTFD